MSDHTAASARLFDDDNEANEYIVARLSESIPVQVASAIAAQFIVYCGIQGELDDWPNARPNSGEISVGAPFLGPWTVREAELSDIKEL